MLMLTKKLHYGLCTIGIITISTIIVTFRGSPQGFGSYEAYQTATDQNPNYRFASHGRQTNATDQLTLLNRHSNTSNIINTQSEGSGGVDFYKQPISTLTKDCVLCKPEKPTLRNDHWQLLRGTAGEILIFGAYFDDRIVDKYFVRLFGVTTTSIEQAVFCQFWSKDNIKPLNTKASILDTGRGFYFWGITYQERLYSCELKLGNPKPNQISLAMDPCRNSTTLLTIFYPPKVQVHQLGICMVVGYGKVDHIHLVEWIELNRILGVGEINVVDSRIEKEARKVFQYYGQTDGFVKVMEISPPVESWCFWCQKLSDIPLLNDCLYRNMYRYQHTIVIDFDEIIIPRSHYDLNGLISHLDDNTLNSYIYTFRNAYFYLELQKENGEALYTASYLHRLRPSKYDLVPKSIVDPRKCLVMQNHYCMHTLPDAGHTTLVSERAGLSHHYKYCNLTHFTKAECSRQLSSPVRDYVALKYRQKLMTSVEEKLQQIGIAV